MDHDGRIGVRGRWGKTKEAAAYALPVLSRVIDKVAQSRYNRLRCVVATAVTLGYEFLLDWTIGLSF